MSNYTKSTNFTTKDTLPSGNSGKIVKGTELDVEFTAIASAVNSKADTNSPTFTGTPVTPTAASGTNTTQIASCAFVLANAVPSGAIMLWSGTIATIPSGWYLCNGSNGTPDLRNKFVVGASVDNAGVANTTITGANSLTGGSADAVVVSHTHTATSVVTDPSHTHATTIGGGTSSPNGLTGPSGTPIAAGSGSTYGAYTGITVGTTITATGSSATNANLPPYYALAYIQKS